jgi:hypothetical protein
VIEGVPLTAAVIDDQRAGPLPPGTEAPDFELRSSPNQTLALRELRGKPAAAA